MKRKVLWILSFALIFTLAFTGCAQDASTTPSDSTNAPADGTASTDDTETKHYKFGITFQTLDNQHWLRMQKGIEDNLKEGDELIVLNAKYDSALQISQVEDLISKGCDAIFVVPVDGAAIQNALKSCEKANIPVFAIDIEPDTREYTKSVVVTDNYQAGVLMGEALIRESGGEAKVGVLAFDAVEAARLRIEGFKDTIANEPGIEIVIEQDAMPSTEEGYPVLENMLQAKPEITDFVCVNDLQAFAGIQVCKGANRPDIRIYAVDGNPDAAKAFLEGTMTGTAAQFPDKEGQKALELAYQYLSGDTEMEEAYLIAPEWIDKSNAQEYLDSIAASGAEV